VLRLRQKGRRKKSKRLTSRVKTERQNEGKRLSGLPEGIFNRTLSLFAENNAGWRNNRQSVRKRYRECAISQQYCKIPVKGFTGS